MKSTSKVLVKRGKRVARKALDKVETELMAAVGRKSVRTKVGTVKKAAAKVGRAAVKAGLIAGATAVAGIVVEKIRKRRSDR